MPISPFTYPFGSAPAVIRVSHRDAPIPGDDPDVPPSPVPGTPPTPGDPPGMPPAPTA